MTQPNQDAASASIALGVLLDCACGHVDKFNNYMYRRAPSLLLGQPSSTGHDAVLGWMADGFPVYGPKGDNQQHPGDLDACGGHDSDSGNGGLYHYHVLGGASTCSQAGAAPTALQLPRCLVGCIRDDTVNAASLQALAYDACLQQPFMSLHAAASFPSKANVPAGFGNCSQEFKAVPHSSSLGLSDVNNGLLSILVGVSLLVLTMVMCVMFRDDMDMCCAPGQSIVHRKDPPRRCRSRICCHADINAGGNCDLCITRCRLNCCAPRESANGGADVLLSPKSALNKTQQGVRQGLASTLSFRRKMQMTLTQQDIEAQQESESHYMDEIDEFVSNVEEVEDTGSLFFRKSSSIQTNSKRASAHVVPHSAAGGGANAPVSLPKLKSVPSIGEAKGTRK